MEPAGVIPSLIGARAYDPEGARVGHVADVLFDAATGEPGWLSLVLLRAEARFVLVPATGVRAHPRGVHLAVARALIRTAPAGAQPPGELSGAHVAELAAHYGVRSAPGPFTGTLEPELAGAVDRVRMVA